MVSIILQLAAILAFPFVVSGSVAYFAWGDLRRPWLYLVVPTGVLYVAYDLAFVFLGETTAGFFRLREAMRVKRPTADLQVSRCSSFTRSRCSASL